ncbi:Vacuolar protein sorting-associated protein 33A [Manis javanica]|nr:Vacuolar protein sorting-associated protein 33A [Manis javanica]
MLAVAVQAGRLALGRSPGRVKGPPASGGRTWDARQLDAAKPADVELAQKQDNPAWRAPRSLVRISKPIKNKCQHKRKKIRNRCQGEPSTALVRKQLTEEMLLQTDQEKTPYAPSAFPVALGLRKD